MHRTCPLSGVKRTSPNALHMSAYDPKRTLRLVPRMHETDAVDPTRTRPSPGAEQGMSEASVIEVEDPPVVLVDRGMFTPFGKRTTVGILVGDVVAYL